MKRRVLASIVALAAFAAPVVHAQGGAGAQAAAESLFQDGRKAMEAKRYGDACPKFLASERLAPALGTLMNLADCYEKNNQLASAWVTFKEAIGVAQRQNRKNREDTARERADKLEPRLIKLSILTRASGVDIKLDGTALEAAALSTPIPVDAGKHTVEATAKGKKPFSTSVEVSDKNKTPSVEIPPLEDAPPEKTEENGSTGNGSKVEPPKEPPKGWSTQKTVGVGLAGVGVVGLAVGGFFGLKTSSTWSDAKQHCDGTLCDPTGVKLATDAKNDGTISTIATLAGGALLVGGAVLFFTASDGSAAASGSNTNVRVGVGPGSLMLRGSFQ